jgi:hypothetical protein
MTLNNCFIPLLAVSLLFGSSQYDGSTKASVVLAGGVISAKRIVDNSKHKRKDCPVCKGKGWYISGDGISKVDCGYCEPETQMFSPLPPSVLQSGTCINNSCSPKSLIIKR